MADDVVPTPSVPDLKTVDPQQAVDAVFAGVLPPQPLAPEPIVPPPAPTIAPPVLPPTPLAVPTAVAEPSPAPTPQTPPSTMTEELPLSLAAPVGSVPAPIPPKSKKSRKALAFLGGFVVLISGILGGGYYFYNNYLPPQPSTIAGVLVDAMTQAECHGCWNGGKLVWRGGQCKVSGTCDPNDISVDAVKVSRTVCDSAGGAWCDACNGFCNLSKDKGCHQLQVAYCGEYPQLGGNIVACDSPQALTKCTKAGECGKCFDTYGLCDHETTPGVPDGLCAIVPMISPNASAKVTNYYFCENVFTNLSGGCNEEGKPKNMSCYCGTLQIDGPTGFTSQTMKCGCEGAEPSVPTNPEYSMSCTGITKNVASPVVGSKITFTCAGATVPAAGATLLKYDFRYGIDSGAWKAMTNKTKTTAELTIVACGSYNVQCSACVTFGGKTQCDPIWQGATQ